MLKCGEDDDGNTIRVKFKYFMKYLKVYLSRLKYAINCTYHSFFVDIDSSG